MPQLVMPLKPIIPSTHQFHFKVPLSTLNLSISTLKRFSFDYSSRLGTAKAGR